MADEMSGAEFACAREFLGLPTMWVAAKLGVNVKTINDWERPERGNVREDAQAFMTQMLSMAEQAVATMTLKWPAGKDIPVPHGRNLSPNSEYPASFHRAMASRVAERTKARIIYLAEGQTP